MWLSFICVCMFCLTFTKGQFGSYEVKQIDFTPIPDAIIFNDIAEIINEFENSMNPQSIKNLFSVSDSGEDIDDLLSEYQHYVDKAHKQRLNYIKKSKSKNKVPLLHHEKYTKIKQSTRNKYDVPNDYSDNMKYTLPTFPEPLNFFMLHNAKLSGDYKPEFTDRPQDYRAETPNVLTQPYNENELHNLIPTISNFNKPIPSCYCKVNQIPCKCSCKQCFILTDTLPSPNKNKYDKQNIFIESFPKNSKYTLQNKINNYNEDKLNIRIKIDVQMPKLISELIHKYRNQDKTIEGEGIQSKEIISTMNLPFPRPNFPIPIDLLGYKMYNKHDNSAVHKISIHKKKKSRLGNNSKKHLGKKAIPFHSVKQDQLIEHNITDENNKISKNMSMDSHSKEIEDPKLHNKKPQNGEIITYNGSNNTVTEFPLKNVNDSIQTIYLTVNITKNNDNDTSESLKIENSIETDVVEKKSTVDPLRIKREALEKNIISTILIHTNMTTSTVIPLEISPSIENYTKETKKFNKSEVEIDYWPIESKNVTLVKSKNITALILEREIKKAKLNMTHEKIRSNRTLVLEHAIFGDVDWNDVDTVAPVFMSFVGKYIRGVLTFCSQSVCHSMKCFEKTCLHRICTPDNRFHYKGHCTGNKHTDSVAAMESIMDLPSNIIFEIVDILQDKMLGKMYGKATLCIISKCTTFVASKKFFKRSKCTSKELSSLGHCPIV